LIRKADTSDLEQLVALEERSFESDRLSRDSFHHLITSGSAETLVDMRDGRVVAYVVVLFRSSSTTARLYSIAVSEDSRGGGVGRSLVEAAESAAIGRGRDEMRLEIREDNRASSALFEKLGYTRVALTDNYYEDGMSAVRYAKILEKGKGTRA